MSSDITPSVVRYREPETPVELAHAIRLMLTDAFGWCVSGGLDDDGGELEVTTGDGREVTIVVAPSDRLAARSGSD